MFGPELKFSMYKNVVFWRVFARVSGTAAKSRTNLSTNSGKSTNKLPLDTQGGTWGGV